MLKGVKNVFFYKQKNIFLFFLFYAYLVAFSPHISLNSLAVEL